MSRSFHFPTRLRYQALRRVEAGNDMVMPGLPEDHENIKKELADGTLTMAELKRCIYNTVNIVLQSNMYEGAVSYLDQFDDLDTYLVVK